MAAYISIALGALLLMSRAIWGSATDYTVGDTSGWTTGINYNTWTSGKNFTVGDNLVFNFATGAHTVAEVSSSDYNSCSSNNAISTQTTGPATINLSAATTRYFICTIDSHCSQGMKLGVTVRSSSSGSPSPPPPPSTTPSAPSPTTTGNNSAAQALVPASAMVSLTGLVVLLF